MKMLKKVAAIALAGVLALSVLTGCGSKNNTNTVVDGMNDLAKMAAEDVTGLLQCRSVQAEIIDIEDDGFIINLGSENGIRRGMKFAIEQYSEGYDPDGRSFSQSERASGTYTVQRVDRNTAFLKSNSLDDNLLNIRLHDLAVPML